MPHIHSDGGLVMTATIGEEFVKDPTKFNPRKHLGPAREELKNIYMHKTEIVLGSIGEA